MITHRKGNLVDALLEGDVSVLLHQANRKNTMGSGIAKEVKKKFPAAYWIDTRVFNKGHNHLGSYSIARENGKTVVNLYGQDGYTGRRSGKRDTQYWALFKAISTVKDCLRGQKIGIPYKIGCDRGGGNWDLVYKFIQEELQDFDVYIYEYNPEEKD